MRLNADSSQFQLLSEEAHKTDSADIALILIHHLVNNKKKYGVVVKSQDVSSKVDEFCKSLGLPVVETPTGFQNISQVLKYHQIHKDNVLLAIGGQGELVTIGGMPVPDGYLNIFRLLEFFGKTKQSIFQTVSELNKKLANYFTVSKWVFKTNAPDKFYKKLLIAAKSKKRVGICQINPDRTYKQFLESKKTYPDSSEVKIYFVDGSWVLVRPRTSRKDLFDVILNVKTVKSKCWWLGEKFHENRVDVIKLKVKELFEDLDRNSKC